jgi:hypothetical protein
MNSMVKMANRTERITLWSVLMMLIYLAET